MQCSAAGAIASFGNSGVEHLIKALENTESSEMQYGLASWALCFIGAKAPEAIKRAARSKKTKVRSAAICALEEQIKILHDQEAIDLLNLALQDPEENVQIEAIRLTGNLGEIKNFTPILINKLKHENPEIRKTSIIALMQLAAKESLESLINLYSREKVLRVRNILKLAIRNINK